MAQLGLELRPVGQGLGHLRADEIRVAARKPMDDEGDLGASDSEELREPLVFPRGRWLGDVGAE